MGGPHLAWPCLCNASVAYSRCADLNPIGPAASAAGAAVAVIAACSRFVRTAAFFRVSPGVDVFLGRPRFTAGSGNFRMPAGRSCQRLSAVLRQRDRWAPHDEAAACAGRATKETARS